MVFEKTVSAAQFVTVLQEPDTSTQYLPPKLEVTSGKISCPFVCPSRTSPSFSQRKLNGPVPEGWVAKVAVPPGHIEVFASGVVVTFVRTVIERVQVLCNGPSAIAT